MTIPSITRLVPVPDLRPPQSPAGAPLRRYRLARVPAPAPAEGGPGRFEYLKKSYD